MLFFLYFLYEIFVVLIVASFEFRVKSNGVMRCLKVRNFGSSIPVRYIPKNSPKPRKPLVSKPPKYDFEEQNKHTCLDLNVGRAESSYGKGVFERRFAPKKPPKPEHSRSLVAPGNDFDEISRHGSLESDVLGLESVDGGKIMVRSFGSLDLNDGTGRFPRTNLTFQIVFIYIFFFELFRKLYAYS